MPKKKGARLAKVKKPVAKNQKQSGALMLAEKVEKEFRILPAKLVKLYRQELKLQKQLESKLKADLKKAKTLQKEAQKKQIDTKTTPKQLAKAKKAEAAAAKTLKTLALQMDQLAKRSDTLQIKQTKFTLLGKELARIEKQVLIKASARKSIRKSRTEKVKLQLDRQPLLQDRDDDSAMVSPETETEMT